MRIMVDLDPRDVWRIQDTAERLGVTSGEVLRGELAVRRAAADAGERVRGYVEAGMCDADIATEMGYMPGTVAGIRRGLHLPANRRYQRRTS